MTHAPSEAVKLPNGYNVKAALVGSIGELARYCRGREPPCVIVCELTGTKKEVSTKTLLLATDENTRVDCSADSIPSGRQLDCATPQIRRGSPIHIVSGLSNRIDNADEIPTSSAVSMRKKPLHQSLDTCILVLSETARKMLNT
jgi:hypothetical protein